MSDRIARIERTTRESSIVVELNLDGTGIVDVSTGVPFFDHMLNALGTHASFDLDVKAKATSRSTLTTPSRTPRSSSARRSARHSATRRASVVSATLSSRWTKRWRTRRSTSPVALTACTPVSPTTWCIPSSAGTRAFRITR